MELLNKALFVNQASTKQQAAEAALGVAQPNASAVQVAKSELAAEQAATADKAVAGEALKAERNAKEFLVNLATSNVSAQAIIDGNVALAATVNRALAYANASDNYLPLLKLIDSTGLPADKTLTTVPAEFVVPAPAAAA